MYARGTRALHAAASAGEVDTLRSLLQAGAQPNVIDGDGWTPLMAACGVHSSAPQPVQMLLEASALPSLADKEGRIPLHTAAHWGADGGIKEIVAAAPGTLNLTDHDDNTPLATAVQNGQEGAVRLLLSVGASANEAWTEDRESSLEVAVKRRGCGCCPARHWIASGRWG